MPSLSEKIAYLEASDEGKDSSRSMMVRMLVQLLAMYFLYYELHWKYQRHYGDHLLFSRIYEAIAGEFDSLAEKVVGYHGTDAFSMGDLVVQAGAKVSGWGGGPIERALASERDLQNLFHELYDLLKAKDLLPMGLDDYIMAVCNDHETNTYLLQQVKEGREMGKEASLCGKIAGTLNESDFARFNETFADPRYREVIEKSAMVGEVLQRLTAEPVVSGSQLAELAAEKVASVVNLDVVQVRPHGYGYIVKYSQAPEGVAPQEQEMSAPEAQQALPQEALQGADEQGAATMTGVDAEPDPMTEAPPQPVEGFGLYKCMEQGTGKQIVGYVIPGLFDPKAGAPTGMSLFVTGGQHALQPSILGKLVGMNFDLPHSEYIRGKGIFYKTNGKALMATVPYNIVSEVAVEGRKYYSGQDPATGEEVQITISEGLKKPVATSPTEIAIPSDFQFLGLDNEIALEDGGGATAPDEMAQQKQAALPTMMEIRAWEGGCLLGGPVFEKVGSGEYDWVDGVFWMAATGVPQNMSVALLEKAASSQKPLRIYGCRPLSPPSDMAKQAEDEAIVDMMRQYIPTRHNLLLEAAVISQDKTAAAMVGTDSIDSVLALNFVNPENISTFLDNLPMLEEASTKIASLVLATQLGLQSISKTAAVRAMFALEDVIEGLKTLQEHKI